MPASRDVLRLVQLAQRLQYMAQHGKANESERAWARAHAAGVTNFTLQQVNAFGPAAALGMGGQAYLSALEKHAAAAAATLQARAPQGAGVWSWDPNKWGMTPEQANAYDLAKASAEAQISQVNPGIIDSISQAAQGATKAAGSVSTTLLWVGAAGLVVWGISEIVAARGESLATGYVRTARAVKEA